MLFLATRLTYERELNRSLGFHVQLISLPALKSSAANTDLINYCWEIGIKQFEHGKMLSNDFLVFLYRLTVI